MIQTISGIIVLLIGGYYLFVGVRHTQLEPADQHKGFIGRFGKLMVGLIIVLVGVILVVPAQDAEPNSETPNSSLEQPTPST